LYSSNHRGGIQAVNKKGRAISDPASLIGYSADFVFGTSYPDSLPHPPSFNGEIRSIHSHSIDHFKFMDTCTGEWGLPLTLDRYFAAQQKKVQIRYKSSLDIRLLLYHNAFSSTRNRSIDDFKTLDKKHRLWRYDTNEHFRKSLMDRNLSIVPFFVIHRSEKKYRTKSFQ